MIILSILLLSGTIHPVLLIVIWQTWAMGIQWSECYFGDSPKGHWNNGWSGQWSAGNGLLAHFCFSDAQSRVELWFWPVNPHCQLGSARWPAAPAWCLWLWWASHIYPTNGGQPCRFDHRKDVVTDPSNHREAWSWDLRCFPRWTVGSTLWFLCGRVSYWDSSWRTYRTRFRFEEHANCIAGVWETWSW